MGFETENNSKQIISPYEIDIYIPERNLAIEFNGLYWHTENQGKHIWYHYNKWLECKKQGIQLIQIWSDDWEYKPNIVKNMLAHKLQKQEKVYNTIIKEISADVAASFLNSNHIQGNAEANIRIGIYNQKNDVLVAVGVYKQVSGNEIELIRYSENTLVRDGLRTCIEYVKGNYSFERMITFDDHCFSDSGLYESLGFVAVEQIDPDYFCFINKRRISQADYRKSFSNLHFERLWDAGKTKYELCIK